MNSKLKDLDLDMDDIQGEVSIVTEEPKKKGPVGELVNPVVKKKVTPLAPQDEWEACLSRMDRHIDKTWICLSKPVDGKIQLTLREIGACTGKEFMDWVDQVWPAAKGGHTPEDYQDKNIREKSFSAVFTLTQSMLMHYPAEWK